MMKNRHLSKAVQEQGLSLVGKDVFEKLVKGYTEKQWVGKDILRG